MWFESVRATFSVLEISNALPAPMLRQVFLEVQNRAPMLVKLTFSQTHRFAVLRNYVLPAWEVDFHGFLFSAVMCAFGGHLETSSFTCMGAHF